VTAANQTARGQDPRDGARAGTAAEHSPPCREHRNNNPPVPTSGLRHDTPRAKPCRRRPAAAGDEDGLTPYYRGQEGLIRVTADNDDRAVLLEAALALARRSWRVFPLRPRDKRPAVRNWETRATADPDRITRAWTAGPFNIGIACGPSRLVVIDLDRPKPGAVPPPACRQRGIRDGGDVLAMLCEALDQPLPVDTYTVRTGSGGTHLYFTTPAGVTLRNTAGRLGWLIDTRAAGGYVVASGSIVAGRAYSAVVDVEAMPLPCWLTEQLTEPEATPDPAASPVAAGNPNAYAAAALRSELDRVLIAQEGSRNHTLNAAAFALGQLVGAGLLWRQFAQDALTLAGLAIGLPARECAATIRSGLDSGQHTPRQSASGQGPHQPAA
jgi:Bifunctional DNA primase/polymerase, N-terminal